MAYKQICSEYFGDISAELVLQNITNDNPNYNTIDSVRELVREFSISAEYEFTELKMYPSLVGWRKKISDSRSDL